MGRTKGTYSQTERVLVLLDRLRTRRSGIELIALSQEPNISRQQLYRDKEVLQRLGHNIEETKPEGRTVFRLVEPASRRVELTRRERFTLLALAGMSGPLRDTFIHEDIENISCKLLQHLSPTDRAEAEAFSEAFLHIPDGGVKSYRGKREIIDDLLTGVLQRRFVRYAYNTSSGRSEAGVLAPYALVLYRNGLYVVGGMVDEGTLGTPKVKMRREPGPYAVERFRSTEVIPRLNFTRPRDLRVRDLFNGAFGIHIKANMGEPQRVVIEFSRDVRQRVMERLFHPTQQTEQLPDGRVRLTFQLCDLTELPTWILGFGRHAHVCEPVELVDKVREEMASALRRYAAPAAALTSSTTTIPAVHAA
jgi:proteasome accessory factor B